LFETVSTKKTAGREASRRFSYLFKISEKSSVSAAVEVTPVEPSPSIVAEPAVATASKTFPIKFASSAKTVPPAYKGMLVEARAPIETGPPIIAMVPRAGPNEDSADEPVRTVVAIGCASVRVIPVVAIGAYRGVTVTAANSNGNPNLCPRRSRQRKHANRQ